MNGSFWTESNAWWRQAIQDIADDSVTRRLWQLSRAVEEASDLIYQDREDLVQMVLVKLQDAEIVNRVAEVDTPAHYLAAVMRNYLVDILNKRKAALRAFHRRRRGAETGEHERPALERAAQRDSEAQVRFIVNHVVSAEERTLLWGFYRDELSIEELSERTGLTKAAVAKRLSRARKRLKDLLRE